MEIYIATSLENAEAHRALREQLEQGGHRITYDWTQHGSAQAEEEARQREVAEAELDGVRRADVVIVLLPGGRGTHTELGFALALGKPVLIHGTTAEAFNGADGRICVFYRLARALVTGPLKMLGAQLALVGPPSPRGVAGGPLDAVVPNEAAALEMATFRKGRRK